MPRSLPINVWLAGDFGHADFAGASGWLSEVADCVAAPSHVIRRDAEPDAIVIFQSRPGSIPQRDVERLYRLAPLARLVLIAGPWCEGELRSGRPPHGVARILWGEWRQRLPQELGLGRLGKSASQPRVRTMTPVDRLLQSLRLPAMRALRCVHVSICTPRRDRFETLSELCSALALRTVHLPPDSQPTDSMSVILADGWQCVPAQNSKESASRPVILLLDWPRPDDLQRAQQCGVASILGQPLLATNLFAAIEALVPADARAEAA